MKKKVYLLLSLILLILTIVVVVISQVTKSKEAKGALEGAGEDDFNTITLADSGVKVSFSEVILGPKIESRKLIVFTQEGEVTAHLNQNVIEQLNLKALKKSQDVTYWANANFVVDLDALTEENLIDDKENKTLTILIDHPRLDAMEIDPNKIEIGEQKKGLLAFGDIKMTVQDYNDIEKELRTRFKEKFDTSANGQEADDLAIKAVTEIYTPVVKAVDSKYKLQVQFK